MHNLKQMLIPSTSGVTWTLAATAINAKDLLECGHLGDKHCSWMGAKTLGSDSCSGQAEFTQL
jgi:hypothetical protein